MRFSSLRFHTSISAKTSRTRVSGKALVEGFVGNLKESEHQEKQHLPKMASFFILSRENQLEHSFLWRTLLQVTLSPYGSLTSSYIVTKYWYPWSNVLNTRWRLWRVTSLSFSSMTKFLHLPLPTIASVRKFRVFHKNLPCLYKSP